MTVPNEVIIVDLLSAARANRKVALWEKIKSGVIIRTNESQDPDERIKYWNEQEGKYVLRILDYATTEIILSVLSFIPDELVNAIKLIFKL